MLEPENISEKVIKYAFAIPQLMRLQNAQLTAQGAEVLINEFTSNTIAGTLKNSIISLKFCLYDEFS